MEFNLNNYVKVKLTDRGRAIHRKQQGDLLARYPTMNIAYKPVEEDADGWSEWQLWVLMNTFGKHLENGCDLPIETTIQIIPCTAS